MAFGFLKSDIPMPPMAPSKDPAGHPLFAGAISRWVWRIYTQRLTPPGRWFALATLIFIGYGGASIQLQGYVLAGYATAAWLVAAGGLLFYKPKVHATFRFSPRVCAGEVVPMEIDVEQLSRFRGADLIALPHRLPLEIDAVPEEGVPLPDLKRGQRVRVRVGLRCARRGLYTLHGVRVETGFPFGILRARKTFRQNASLIVYPKFSPLSRLKLPMGRRYQPGGVALASHMGESFEYLGNREYREGDNVRDIDWRSTARVGRPIVREWVEEYMLRVAVILDTHVPKGLSRAATKRRRDAFERAVSVAAALSDSMARQDYLVDLFAAGPNLYHLTAGRSLAYLDQILDILACVDESPAEPFEVIEPQIAELLSRISTVICVFLDFDEARRSFVHRLHRQGVAVKLIVVRDEPCTLDPAGDPELAGGVPIVRKEEYDLGITEL